MIKALKGAGLVAVIALTLVVILIIALVVIANLSGPPGKAEAGDLPSSVAADDHSGGGGGVAETGAPTDPGRPSPTPAVSPTASPAPTPADSPPASPASTPTPDTRPPASLPPTPEPSPSPPPSPPPPPDPDTMSPTGILAYDAGIESALDAIAKKYGAVGVQVAVVDDGLIAGTYSYGYATRNTSPMTVATKIRSASLSKIVLTMVIMQMAEDGLLDIDEDIGLYWDMEIRNPNHRDIPITMRQMLSHTSSVIAYEFGYSAGGDKIRGQLRNGSCFGRKTPGKIGSWEYNNYAFSILGLTVELAADETVNSYAARRLFAPLDIDSGFGAGSIAATERLATIYTYGGGGGRSIESLMNSRGNTFPGERGDDFPGGLTISAYDFAKLMTVLANRGEYGGVRVLSPDSVALMESSQGRVDRFDQGLAIRRIQGIFGEDELFYHTGSAYGVFTLASYNPENRSGVVVFTTGADGRRDSAGVPVVCAEISKFIYELIRHS